MKRWLLGVPLLFVSLVSGQQFQLGSKVDGIAVHDLKGNPVQFSNFDGKTTVVLFIATKCPVSNAYNERMNTLYKDYHPKDVQFIFINSNHSEPASEVEEHIKDHALAFEVYKDPNNVVADRFGAQVTPEAFVIDQSGTIRYHGHIDDSQNEARIRNRGLRTALDQLLAGQTVQKSETKAFGCTIKRRKAT